MKVLTLVISCFFFATLLGCASATPVQPEPLPADQESQLNCLLPGTWYHTSYGDGAPLIESAQNAYILNADGTGHIQPNSGGQAMFGLSDRMVEFEWELDGRNLHMRRDDDQIDVYRVDGWSASEMEWFFYNGSTEYGVTRSDEVPNCE